MRLASLVILTVVIAGCVSVPGSEVEPNAASTATADPFNGLGDPLVVDHDHGDAALHDLASASMTLLASTRFEELGAPTLAFGEADLLGEDHLVIAGFVGTGFFIADVSDPASPKPVSYTPEPGMIGDVKASKSGDYVFVGTQIGYGGVKAYNVAVPERPFLAGTFPLAGTQPFRGGCHMLAVHESHLYCAPNDATVRIYEIVETPAVVALTPVGIYAPYGAPVPLLAGEDHGGEFTHDMTVQADPLTGEPVMYVSFWDYGLAVVDVSDPADPTELGVWKGEGAEEWGTYYGAVHTAMGSLVGGKRVLAYVPEYADVPAVHFIDATDYAAMTALGVWAPKPAEAWGDAASTFSTHNFQFIGEKVYLAMYHGGVWVIDASDPTHPLPVGYYLPTGSGTGLGAFGGGATSTWDVVVKDGVILASDMPNGLFAIQFEGDVGKTGLTSFA